LNRHSFTHLGIRRREGIRVLLPSLGQQHVPQPLPVVFAVGKIGGKRALGHGLREGGRQAEREEELERREGSNTFRRHFRWS